MCPLIKNKSKKIRYKNQQKIFSSYFLINTTTPLFYIKKKKIRQTKQNVFTILLKYEELYNIIVMFELWVLSPSWLFHHMLVNNSVHAHITGKWMHVPRRGAQGAACPTRSLSQPTYTNPDCEMTVLQARTGSGYIW